MHPSSLSKGLIMQRIAVQFLSVGGILWAVHAAALDKPTGTVIAWGDIAPTPLITNAVAVSVKGGGGGGAHGLALLDNGTVTAWGNNNFGQATPPADLTNAVAIAAGSLHSVAVRADGTVVCWGRNLLGES